MHRTSAPDWQSRPPVKMSGWQQGLGPDDTAGRDVQGDPHEGHERRAHRRAVLSAAAQPAIGAERLQYGLDPLVKQLNASNCVFVENVNASMLRANACAVLSRLESMLLHLSSGRLHHAISL